MKNKKYESRWFSNHESRTAYKDGEVTFNRALTWNNAILLKKNHTHVTANKCRSILHP